MSVSETERLRKEAAPAECGKEVEAWVRVTVPFPLPPSASPGRHSEAEFHAERPRANAQNDRAEQAEAATETMRSQYTDLLLDHQRVEAALARWQFIGTHDYTERRPKYLGGGPGVVDRPRWEVDGLNEAFGRALAEE